MRRTRISPTVAVAVAVTIGLTLAPMLRAQSVPHDSIAADSLSHRRIQLLPALASAPETGLQYGANVLAVWQPAARQRARPSTLTATALRTAKAQTRLRLAGEHWSPGNARRIGGTLQWQEFPLPYFGIGDATPESAEETFIPTGIEAAVSLQQRVAGAWYATTGVRRVDQRITSDSTRALRTGAVLGAAGGRITEWSLGAVLDTRDNLFAPRSGDFTQLTYARAVNGLFSDFGFGTLRLDARRYRPIRTEHVVALQLQLTAVDGAAPFDQLALVGNSEILRGYARGRYRDRAVAAAQAEYRSPIRHRVGAVVFAGAGTVGPSIGALASQSILPTYGAGLRFELDRRQRSGVRADYGRGRDGASGIYLGFNNAF